MMPRPPGAVDPYKWTLDLPAGPLCSVGWSANTLVSSDGSTSNTGRPDEDRYYTCNFQDKVQLYMVLDGHDGVRACDFVQKHLPNVFLRCDLDTGGEAVNKALETAFRNTEREFFKRIDPHIARKITLQIEISQKASNSIEAVKRFPNQVEEIERLDSQIKGGTTVAVAAIYNQKLYVANVGDTRVLLCSMTPDGQLKVNQLSVDHNTSNDDELQRLANCGLDPSNLKRTKRVGTHQNSRSIGDYSIKGGYKDIDIISHATMEPGTAEPFICDPIDLSNVRGFLVLMSDGLYEAYEAWTKRPAMVNTDVAHLIANEMKKTTDISIVAQNVVEKVKSLFRTICQRDHRSGRLDDITLIVRNFGFPMAPGHSASHPPNFVPAQQIQGHPTGIMQSMSVQPYSKYPQYQSYNPSATASGYPYRVDAVPHYQTNVPDSWRQGGGRDVHFGGHVSMQYPPQSDQYGRSVSFAPTGAYYTSGQSTATTNTMGAYQQSGYNTPGVSSMQQTGYSTTDFQAPLPSLQQQSDVSTTATNYHHQVQHTRTEPSFKQGQLTQQHGGYSIQSPPYSQISPRHFQGTSTTITDDTLTTPVSTQGYDVATFSRTQKKLEYENTKSGMQRLQVDPNDKSPYVNVRPSNGDDQSKRLKRLSDSVLDEKRVEESSNKSQEYPPLHNANPTPLPQTPPVIRPKSAGVSETTTDNRTPESKPIPAPRTGSHKLQKSDETQQLTPELKEIFDMYGAVPTTLMGSTPQSPPQSNEERQENAPSDNHQGSDNSDSEEAVFRLNPSDTSGVSGPSGDEQDVMSGEFINSYVRNWPMRLKELSWDDISVDL